MNIVTNRKALHDYFIEDKFEAGIVLEGWELKSIRGAKVQLRDSYVRFKNSEIWLLGCHIAPLITASTHVVPDVMRDKKLLLHQHEISRLIGKVEQRGYSMIALDLHFNARGKVKVTIALAKGKKLYDKRATIKERELAREQQRGSK